MCKQNAMKFKSISTATYKNFFLSNSSLADTNPFTEHVCSPAQLVFVGYWSWSQYTNN